MSKMKAYLYSESRPTQEQEKRFEAFLRGKYGAGTELEWVESNLFPGGFRHLFQMDKHHLLHDLF